MNRSQFASIRWALAVWLLAGGTTLILAQAPAAPGHHEATTEPARPQAGATMMGDQKAMMARMAAGDQKLKDLIGTMNKATGDAKVAAIAAVVTELVAQRTEMQAQMMRMQSGMMDRKVPEPAPAAADQDHAAHHPDK